MIVVISVVAGAFGTALFSFLFIYSPVTVTADGLSGRPALVRSLSVGRRIFGASVINGVVSFVFTSAVTYAASAVPGASLALSSIVSACVLILVTPVLHMAKTEIYRKYRSAEPPSAEFKPFFG